MKKIMSYIFLERNENKKLKRDKEGNFILDLSDTLYSRLDSLYNIHKNSNYVQKEIESIMKKKQCGVFKITCNNKIRNIEYEITSATGTYFLDIISDERKIIDNISVLEKIHNDLVGQNNMFDDRYIVIVSYDSISEYYCNRIYSKLNLFERKFRKLLLITYTAKFKKAYFEITVSDNVRNKVKKNIKSKNNDDRLKNYLYSLEFGIMRELLFEKNWNEYDEKEVNKFLDENEDLSKLTDEELRKFINNIHPKSDWERLFLEKGFDDNFEETIKIINDFRNSVAHCKFFYKEDYLALKDLLNKTNKTIDSAISYTESEEFTKLNTEAANRKIKQLIKQITSITKQYTDIINNYSINWINEVSKYTQSFKNEIFDSIKQSSSLLKIQDKLRKENNKLTKND